MRVIAITSTLGALVGFAVYAVLHVTDHIRSGSGVFGWYSYAPRRYTDYLAVPSGSLGNTTAWWLVMLLAIAIGLGVGAAAGIIAALAGVKLTRRA